LIANTDLTAIDSFAEVSDAVSAEVSRAESTEASLAVAAENFTVDNRPSMRGFKGGELDGTNAVFITDVLIDTQIVFLNGLMQTEGDDYTIAEVAGAKGMTVTQVTFNSSPASTDKVDIYGVDRTTTFG
jgi:hypothetical protein